jgi:hypothetical protein
MGSDTVFIWRKLGDGYYGGVAVAVAADPEAARRILRGEIIGGHGPEDNGCAECRDLREEPTALLPGQGVVFYER